MIPLQKLKKGDCVAILSPSFGAPGTWPHVYQLGLTRLRDEFQLVPIEFPTTTKVGASAQERAEDLVNAFKDPEIKAVIASIGGDDQVTYINKLSPEIFTNNPKPFFGFSDNTHFANFLWLQGIPSYYGGALFTQFAMQGEMNEYTVRYWRNALFEEGTVELVSSIEFNDIGLNWNDPTTLSQKRSFEPNDGWFWDIAEGKSVEGITWGGCLESIDDLLRNNIQIPSLEQFKNSILMIETSEEIPTSEYVFRVLRALGGRKILEQVVGLVVGRPKSWEFNNNKNPEERKKYREEQRNAVLRAFRNYNTVAPVVQNLDFGHTDPQIPMPYGSLLKIDTADRRIFAHF